MTQATTTAREFHHPILAIAAGIASLLMLPLAPRDAHAAVDNRLSAEARQALNDGRAEEAYKILSRALLPGGPRARVDAPEMTRRAPREAALLARAAERSGHLDLAHLLFESLHDRAREAGDQALAARFAIRTGDVLCAAGSCDQAIERYQRAAVEDVVERALLGQARALRLADKPDAGLATLEQIRPLELETTHPLRAQLLAEGARCAEATADRARREAYLAELWSAHPGRDLGYPGFSSPGQDPNPLRARAPSTLRAAASAEGVVRRSEALLAANSNRQAIAVATEEKFDRSDLRCRAQYVHGKALRNLRRYSSAERVLKQVVEGCSREAPKALYLLGRVVSFRGRPEEARAHFDRFATSFPKHDFTDDVLFFAGDQLTQSGHHTEAERYYQRVVDECEQGDYHDEAQWRLAWSAHLRGDDRLAVERLDTIARSEAGAPDPRPYQRAVYWRARLSLAGAGRSAIDDLDGLVRADPVSLYGVLARALLHDVAADRAKVTDRWLKERAIDLTNAAGRAPAPPPALPPSVRLGHALVAAGLDEEGRDVLSALDHTALPLSAAVNVARDLVTCGDTHNAHWIVRRRAELELRGLPDPSDVALWRAGFPLGYADLVDSWAEKRTLDNKLVYSLIREESAFDAPVVSWAGAVGLMQIMPSTAKEEAQLDKLAGFSTAQLTDPAVNVRLGTAHIARRLKYFKGNAPLAIASYNAGPANVRRWLSSTPGDELDVYLETIPIEQTRHYTKRVVRTWAVYRFLYHPESPLLQLPGRVK